MISEMKQLQDLLDKYQMTRPIPAGVRRDILAHKRRNFVAIMKKLDRYSPLLGAFLFVYFLVRKFGIYATLKQCGVILAVSAALTVTGVGVGTYAVVSHLIDISHAPVEFHNDEDALEDQSSDIPEPPPQVAPLPLREVKHVMAFQPFDGLNAPSADVSLVSESVKSELVRIRGDKNIISARVQAPNPETNLLLIGTLRRDGANYAITAKVVDRDTGRIRYAATEPARSHTLSQVSKKIADDISKNIE